MEASGFAGGNSLRHGRPVAFHKAATGGRDSAGRKQAGRTRPGLLPPGYSPPEGNANCRPEGGATFFFLGAKTYDRNFYTEDSLRAFSIPP